jgi:hypothetical protein
LIQWIPLLIACAATEPATRAETQAVPMESVMPAFLTDPTGLPVELQGRPPLWETCGEAAPRRPATATRLYEDGRLYTWGATRRVLEGGALKRVPASPAWRLDARVSAAGLAEIRALLSGPSLSALPEHLGAPLPDRAPLTLRYRAGEQERVLVLQGADAARPPDAVRQVQLAIQRNIESGAVPIEN